MLRDELVILELCERYGWTYQEYMAQPHWFTALAAERLDIDAKRRKRTLE